MVLVLIYVEVGGRKGKGRGGVLLDVTLIWVGAGCVGKLNGGRVSERLRVEGREVVC